MKRSNQEEFASDESKQKIGYWPSVNYLRLRTMLGSSKMGMKFIGDGNDSDGSNLIIRMADENDDRPIWISVWGGGNTFAQAIWRVQQERSPEELKAFLSKFRIYTITDQDRPWSQGDTINYANSSHQWMRKFNEGWVIPEAGTYSGEIEISKSDSSIASFFIPTDAAGQNFHIICEVTDDGVHNLTSYRRIILKSE